METQYIGIPVTIRLVNVATSINMEDLATQIFHPLMRDIFEKLQRYGLKFCLPLYLQHQYDVRRVDFRHALLDGLLPDSLSDERNWNHIRWTLQDILNQRMAEVEANLSKRPADERALAERVLAERRETSLARDSSYPLSEFDMAEFVRVTLPARIWQWLDDDVAAGRLKITNICDDQVVLINDLVRWATGRKMLVEQDTLPGCESFVATSYRRLHKQLSEETTLAQPAMSTAESAPPLNIELKRNREQIPGIVPRTDNSKITVELAWEIEISENRRATAKEVMARLMEMATNGDRPDILTARGKDAQSVEWVTSKGVKKNYSIDALSKTLAKWHESRLANDE